MSNVHQRTLPRTKLLEALQTLGIDARTTTQVNISAQQISVTHRPGSLDGDTVPDMTLIEVTG